MKFRPFYIFYLLAFILLLFAILTKDFLIAKATPTADSEYGFLSFFIPMAVFVLIPALFYHRYYSRHKPVQANAIIIQFVLALAGIFLSFQSYLSLTIFGTTHYIGGYDNRITPEANALDLNLPTPLLLAGPLFILIVFILFLVSLNNSSEKNFKN